MKSLLTLIVACTLCAGAQSITTKSYDNARTSANTAETALTPGAVRTRGMRKLPSIPVMGDARGMEAQPLILPGVTIGGVQHDVMVLPSQANIVRGVEAASGEGLWQTAALCVPVTSDRTIDMWGVNDHFGAMSTGVVDADTQKLYQVITCSEDGSGSPRTMRQRMFVLSVVNGSVLANVLIDGTANGQRYSAMPRKQRSALLLTNVGGTKFVWFSAGSFSETSNGSAGWVFGFDTFDDSIKITWASSRGRGAGIWMSSQGIAADTQGRLYLFTGNGAYDGITDFGEAMVQLQPKYPTATTPGSISVLSSWARFSDAGRVGQNPAMLKPTVARTIPNKLAGVNAASDIPGASMPMANSNNAAFGDQDDGLSHTLIEPYGKYLGAGKDGIGVVLDINRFPRTRSADFSNAKANCAKLSAGPYALSAPLGIDLCPNDMTKLNIFAGGKTRHIHSPMAQYKAPDGTLYILVWGENSQLHVWGMSPAGAMTYVTQSAEYASPFSTGGTGGMPGGFCSVSSNGGANAIAWCSVPDGDSNRGITTGHLYAYDLTGLSALQGTNTPLPMIWKSDTYTYNKFMQPIVWHGQVYLPNYAGSVDLYALGQ